ncbi:hypothetical protein LWM68_41570 [Niabella sp. W65]|nr:hypothetical protein [Niabella sp. W65]MCH7368657.1 hypothetical protein [Niabella sp. W65]ULT44235.1 hypothetical protein KRR40_13270 [Niabella sp. I65]
MQIDEGAASFLNLPFYNGLLYNAETRAYLMGLSMDPEIINSKKRDATINEVTAQIANFEKAANVEVKLSGLPIYAPYWPHALLTKCVIS